MYWSTIICPRIASNCMKIIKILLLNHSITMPEDSTSDYQLAGPIIDEEKQIKRKMKKTYFNSNDLNTC